MGRRINRRQGSGIRVNGVIYLLLDIGSVIGVLEWGAPSY